MEMVTRAVGGVPCVVYEPAVKRGGGTAGLIIHLYGRGGSIKDYNLQNPSYARLCRLLAERGYWIVVPELGTDHWMNDAAMESVDTVIAGMKETERIDPARVSIIGVSMGACSGLAYIIRRPGAIRSICASMPITDFPVWIKEVPEYIESMAAAYGVSPADLPPILEKLSSLRHLDAFAKTPLFLLHGGTDTIVPTHHSRDFTAALTKKGYPVTYREVPGVGHDDVVAERSQQEIADFLTGDVSRET